jgi:hypothetical protein
MGTGGWAVAVETLVATESMATTLASSTVRAFGLGATFRFETSFVSSMIELARSEARFASSFLVPSVCALLASCLALALAEMAAYLVGEADACLMTCAFPLGRVGSWMERWEERLRMPGRRVDGGLAGSASSAALSELEKFPSKTSVFVGTAAPAMGEVAGSGCTLVTDRLIFLSSVLVSMLPTDSIFSPDWTVLFEVFDLLEAFFALFSPSPSKFVFIKELIASAADGFVFALEPWAGFS